MYRSRLSISSKTEFPTLDSVIEFSRQEPLISFLPGVSIRDLSGFNPETLYEKHKLSPDPVNIASFDDVFLETDIAQGEIFSGKRKAIFHNLQWMSILVKITLRILEEEFNCI